VKERRSYVRIPFISDVTVTPLDAPGGAFSCTSRNLGADGMRLHLDRDVTPGARVRVTFTLPADPSPVTAEGRIVWTQWLSTSLVDAGVEFSEIEASDQAKIISFIVHFISS